MRYLLDTNVVSDLVRNPEGRITQRIREVGEAQVCTNIIVAAEVRFGMAKRGSQRLSRQAGTVLKSLQILSIEAPVDITYADLRASLEASGQPIGANDLLIASHAVTLGLTLVTDNVREFGRVDGLQVENWFRDD